MNKIVREHYPASKLPEELRQGFGPDATVKIVIEEEGEVDGRHVLRLADGDRISSDRSETVDELLEKIRAHKEKYGSTTSGDEAVQRIRALRDEWDDE